MQEVGVSSKPSLWNSCRLTFTLCVFVGFFFHLCMRLNLSFTIRCMVIRPSIFSQYGANNSIPKEELPCTRNDFRTITVALQSEFTWTKYEQGLLISSFFYGYIVGQPIGGILCQNHGGKALFITGILGQAICTLIFPVTARLNLYAVITVRIIQGFVAGFVIPAAYQMYTIWAHPSERGTLMALAYSGFPVGSVCIFPLSSALCQFKIDKGWPMVFYIVGGSSVFFSCTLYWLIYDSIDKHPRISSKEYDYLKEARQVKARIPKIPVVKIITAVPILIFCAVHFTHSWGFSLIALSIPQMMEELLYVNIKWNGLYSAAPFMASLVSRLLLSLTYQRIYVKSGLTLTVYRKIYHIIGSLSSAVILLIVIFLNCRNGQSIVFLLGILGGVLDLSFIGSYWTSYLELAPAFAGVLSGFTNTLSTLTGIITPNVVSAIVVKGTKTEWDNIFYIMIALYLLSAILYTTLGSSKPLPWGQFLPPEDQNEKKESK